MSYVHRGVATEANGVDELIQGERKAWERRTSNS